MSFSDDLFMLPSDDDSHMMGGEPDAPVETPPNGVADKAGIYALTKAALRERIQKDSGFDINALPIMLVEKDMGAATKPDVKAFVDAGLTEQDIVGVNGALAELILKDRSLDTGIVLKHLVMNVADVHYTSINNILGVQISFIILFHHLMFLANLDDDSFDATIQDNLEKQFNTLSKSIEASKAKTVTNSKGTKENAKPENKKGGGPKDELKAEKSKNASNTLFGKPRTTIISLWDHLQQSYITNEQNKRTYADIEGFIIAGADRVLEYLIKSQVEIQAGIPNNTTEAGFEGMSSNFSSVIPNETKADAKQNEGHPNNGSNASSVTERHGEERADAKPSEDHPNNTSNASSVTEIRGEGEESKIAGPSESENTPATNIVENHAANTANSANTENVASAAHTGDPETSSTSSKSSQSTTRRSANRNISSQPVVKPTGQTRRRQRFRPHNGLASIQETNSEGSNNANNIVSIGSTAVRRSRKLRR